MATSIRMRPDLEERYRRLARNTGRSQSFYMNQALEDAIDELEWEYDILRIAEECRSGRQETYTVSEVREHLGL